MSKYLKIFLFNLIIMGITATLVVAASDYSQNERSEKSISKETSGLGAFGKYLGAGLAIAGATLGSGMAVGKIGSAAIGAISEKPEVSGISLVFVALAEGISLWGFLVAFFILQQ